MAVKKQPSKGCFCADQMNKKRLLAHSELSEPDEPKKGLDRSELAGSDEQKNQMNKKTRWTKKGCPPGSDHSELAEANEQEKPDEQK